MATKGASDLLTVVAIAIVAYAACDMTHEVLGHGIATALSRDVRALSLSTVALQTDRSSRLVAAAGSCANILVGVSVLWYTRLKPDFSNGRFFFWLFATLNLLNGTGYLLFSGLFLAGDWAVVIAGLHPPWAWRMMLVVAGLCSYLAAIAILAKALRSLMGGTILSNKDVPRLVVPSYIAGGVLLVAAACFNPISANLIWLSGVSSGFGAMSGLLLIPAAVERGAVLGKDENRWVKQSRSWQAAGFVVALLFVALLGRGVRLK